MSNTISRALAAVAVAGVAALTVATPALAVDCAAYPDDASCTPVEEVTYPPTAANAVLSGDDLTFQQGELIEFGPIPGYAPNDEADVEIQSTPVFVGTFPTTAAGTVSGSFRMPQSVPAGSHLIVITGFAPDGSILVTNLPITVVADDAGAGGGLPFTGAEVGIASLVGAAALGAGTLMVVAGRRRKAAPAAA